MPIESERQALLDEIEKQFGIKLLWYEKAESGSYRKDVTVHGFFHFSGDDITDETKRNIERWIVGRGWQFSRQLTKHPVDPQERIEYVFLAPVVPVPLQIGFHATRRASVSSIMACGLLPSVPTRQTTDERWDCEGNIYLCEALGVPADAGVQGSKTAHWWRDHLSRVNRFNDPDWVILQVEIGRLPEARLSEDIWSESGIVVNNVEAIPPELIQVVFPP